MTLTRALAAALVIVGTAGAPAGAASPRPVGSVVSATWAPATSYQLVLGGGRAYALSGIAPFASRPAASTVTLLRPNGAPAATVSLVGSLEGGMYGHGGLWFVRGEGARPEEFPGSLDLVKLAARSLAVLGQVYVGRGGGPYVSEHAIWATPQLHSRLLQVNPTTMRVTGVRRFHGYLTDVIAAGNRVWVVEERDNVPGSWLIGVDDQTLRETLVARFSVHVGGLAATADRVFLETYQPNMVLALDPRTGRQLWHRRLSNGDLTVAAAADNSLWYLTTDGQLGHIAATAGLLGLPSTSVDCTRTDSAQRLVESRCS